MTTTATPSWFLAAARIIVGPPMSMFSIATSCVDVVAGDGLLERVEVDADQVDRLDPLALQRRHVLGVVAPRQQRRVQPRVQRLHPAAEDLLLAGELGDVGHLEPGLAQRRGGAAGGEDLDPERRRGPWRSRRPRSCRRPRSAPGAPGSRRRSAASCSGVCGGLTHRSTTTARVVGVDPNPALARSCGSPPGRARARPRGPPPRARARSRPGGHRHLALEDRRPGVDPLVDEVDGDPGRLDPGRQRLADRVEARGRPAAGRGGR